LEIRAPEDAVAAGISYLSEDRQGSGILTGFTVADNITLVSLRAYCDSVIELINGKRQRAAAQQHVDRFNIKTQSLDTRLEFLSGGNQQKVSLAKEHRPAAHRPDRRRADARRRCLRQAGDLPLHQVAGGHRAVLHLSFRRSRKRSSACATASW
jgi:hypothetical protein